jgi:hypothetical protein
VGLTAFEVIFISRSGSFRALVLHLISMEQFLIELISRACCTLSVNRYLICKCYILLKILLQDSSITIVFINLADTGRSKLILPSFFFFFFKV